MAVETKFAKFEIRAVPTDIAKVQIIARDADAFITKFGIHEERTVRAVFEPADSPIDIQTVFRVVRVIAIVAIFCMKNVVAG